MFLFVCVEGGGQGYIVLYVLSRAPFLFNLSVMMDLFADGFFCVFMCALIFHHTNVFILFVPSCKHLHHGCTSERQWALAEKTSIK